MAFDPTGFEDPNLLGTRDVVELHIYMRIRRKRPLTNLMLQKLIDAVNEAARRTDLEIAEEIFRIVPQAGYYDRVLVERLVAIPRRFYITSVANGSVIIGGAVLLGAIGVAAYFLKPGWEKSKTKGTFDNMVADLIDASAERLQQHVAALVKPMKRIVMTQLEVWRKKETDQPAQLEAPEKPKLLTKPRPRRLPSK